MNHVSDEIPAKRGRPRDPARMHRVLEAAKNQFLQQGFSATSMESIAKASGVSKMTIYSYFPNKEALFETCIASRTDEVFSLSKLHSTGQALAQPADILRKVATQFVALMRDEEVLAMHRIMIGSAGQHPDICQSFFAQGCLRLNQQISAYLDWATQAGVLNITDSQRAADQFLSLCLGRQHLQGLLMLGTPTADQDEAMITDNITMFLTVYAHSNL